MATATLSVSNARNSVEAIEVARRELSGKHELGCVHSVLAEGEPLVWNVVFETL